MARLAVFALLAVVACAAAGAPHKPAPAHGLGAWLHAKHAQLSQWGHAESAKLKGAWKKNVVPHIIELEHKLGAEWQKKAPQIAATLKQKLGATFDKAVQFASQQVSKKLQQG